MNNSLFQQLLSAFKRRIGKCRNWSRTTVQSKVKPQQFENIRLGGIFKVNCFDKDGNLRWAENAHNLWVQTGRDYVLSCIFKGKTPDDPLYVGIKRSSGAASSTWSMGNHTTTWTEFTGYKNNRKEFVDGAISSHRINNSASKATFSISATGPVTVYGAFLVNTATTKSGVNGTLMCIDDFAASRSVYANDELQVTYTVGCDDDGV